MISYIIKLKFYLCFHRLHAINGFNIVDVQSITNNLNAVNTQISSNGCSDNDVLR